MPDSLPAAVPAPPAQDASVPYVGLRAFTEEEAALFFGREREAVELTRLVENDTVSILYGVSGVGKSSLLKAGLFPRLRERDFLPVYLRLDHDESAAPPALQLQRAVHAAALGVGITPPEPGENESLWEYFHHPERAEFWTADHRLLTPLLALDQFEEFFSLGHGSAGRRERSAAFREQLLTLLENTPPGAAPVPAPARRLPHFLLILREDFIAQLLPIVDALAERLPGIHRQKLRLLPLLDEAAREVIDGQARALGLEPPDDETARAIVRLASPPGGSGVEPARLALLLSTLESERRARSLPRASAQLTARADADLFTRFVEMCFEGQPAAARIFVEDELVTPAGYRRDVTLDQATSAGVEEATLRLLRERRLLIVRPGSPVRYELSHDLLCPPLRRSREERRAAEADDRARQAAAAVQARVRRAVVAALIAALVAVAAVGGVIFALRARAEAERQKNRALAAKRDADDLIHFVQYDVQDTLRAVGRLDTMAGVNALIQRYQREHPPEASDPAARNSAERVRSVTLEQEGDNLRARGDLAGSLKCYQDALAITQKLVAEDPGNQDWQHGYCYSLGGIGAVQQAQGDLPAALKSYQDSRAVAERLVAREPGNTAWTLNLLLSLNNVGDVQQALGDLPAALKSYQDGRAIAEKLAAQAPDNADWQRDLSLSLNNVGDVQQALNDLPAALRSFQDSRAIAEKLVARDSRNAEWQRDLSVVFERIGGVQQAQGDLPAALESYEHRRAIAEKLVAKDPGNADWQRDLSLSFLRIGDAQQARGDLPVALASYQAYHAIAEKLVSKEPGNALWQRDLAYSERQLGANLLKQGKKEDARSRFERDREIVDRLAAEHPGIYDLEAERAYARWMLAGCVDLAKPEGKEQARQLLRDAAGILRELERSPGLQPQEADWLRDVERDLSVLEK